MASLQQPSANILHPQHFAQLPPLVAVYNPQQQQVAVDPSVFSPVTGSSSSASPPPALLDHKSPRPDYVQYLPDIYPVSTTSSQQNTSGDSAGSPPNPLPTLVSPLPSAEGPFVEDATISEHNEDEDEDEDEYQPTPRRPWTSSRANRRSTSAHSNQKGTKQKPRTNPDLDPAQFDDPSSTNSVVVVSPVVGQPDQWMHPSAPDAEANSEYQCSESGESSLRNEDQARYSGGPKRERSKGQDGRANRGIGKSNHPYKNFKNMAPQGTGKQTCKYTSPYDGWKCEQILARSYDVPRHMEVHAKEEYDLVLTGKLPVQQSGLFDCVTEANVYVCLVCRKDFSRKDAMQRHVRSSSKMSKAKHRAEAKASLKKRVLGTPIIPHPNTVPAEILQRHRRILEKLKVEAQELGQDVTDWDVENMIPQVGDETELFGTGPNAPGIPVGRRGGGKPRMEDTSPDPAPARPTRATNRPAAGEAERDLGTNPSDSPKPDSTNVAPKAVTQTSAKTPATSSLPQQLPTKLSQKGRKRSPEISPPGEGDELDQAAHAPNRRSQSSNAHARATAKGETRNAKQPQRLFGPSSIEVEGKQRGLTESEDEEDIYQEESRRRYDDDEDMDAMEVD